MTTPPIRNRILWTCRAFTAGGQEDDCERQARGEATVQPRGWKLRTLSYSRGAECPACAKATDRRRIARSREAAR